MSVVEGEAARRLEERGKSVIVNCDDCARQVWTSEAFYDEDEGVWLCYSCLSDGGDSGVGL